MKTLLFTLSAASLLALPMKAEQVIGVTGQTTEIPLVDGHAPLHIKQWHEEGNLNIMGHDKASIIVLIDEFDSGNEDRDSATVRYDEKTGRLSVFLRGDLDESDLSYFVPSNSSAEIKNSDGDIEVSGIAGTIEISADDGDIVLTDVGGSIEVRTDDGDIEITGVSGSLVAHSDDGDFEVVVEKENTLQIASLATEDGDIDLILPPDFSGHLAASTADGDFSSDFTLNMGRTGQSLTSNRGLFKVAGQIGPEGSDGCRLSITTSDGDISIRKH